MQPTASGSDRLVAGLTAWPQAEPDASTGHDLFVPLADRVLPPGYYAFPWFRETLSMGEARVSAFRRSSNHGKLP